MSETIERQQEIFERALAISPADESLERSAFLKTACGDDEVLRQNIEVLLRAHSLAVDFIPPRGSPQPGNSLHGRSQGPGAKISRYTLLEKIGEGGMGDVYMAEQSDPVQRRVALKIIKLGMDTKQVVARFEAERQALAMMDHPNIAKVLDGGTTETGRPYFVMELVCGIRITDYCDQAQLSTKDRLDLFIKVCHAIQHAHQKGIIHRDIKSSNILVTLHDDVPVPKVIDFGIAKATEGRLTDATVYTQLHQFIGTPAYMSPEQAEMSGLDIDTRSDIYSLGVLLYELLSGSTPFDAKDLLASGIDAMRKTILEKEPPRPSTRLATLRADELLSTAKRRCADTAKLLHQLQGDLDWIVMKCLEKDRSRRYETANELIADLRRHFDNEPVLACPPSAAYRLGKLLLRNKVAVAATAGVAGALLLGATVSLREAVRATRAEHLAEGQAQRAESGEQTARRNQYVSSVTLAYQAWEDGNLRFAQRLLRAQIPRAGVPDLRGFEWRYLLGLCQDESRSAATDFPGGVVALAVAADGTCVAAAERDVVHLLDLSLSRKLAQLRHDDSNDFITCLAFVPGTTNLLVTGGRLGSVRRWNFKTGEIAVLAHHPSEVGSIAISPGGKLLAIASGRSGHALSVYDLDLGSLLWTTNTAFPPWAAAFTPDGHALVSGGGGGNGNPQVWDVDTWNKLPAFPELHKGWVHHIALSLDGQTMATSAADGQIMIWNFPERRLIAPPLTQGGGAMAFSRDGRKMAAAGPEVVRIWELNSGHAPRLLRGHLGIVSDVAFVPTDDTIISSGLDHSVRRWEMGPNTPTNVLKAHQKWVHCVAFSADDQKLASVDYAEGSTRVWDLRSRRVITNISPPHVSFGLAAAFSPDTGALVTSTYDGVVRLWDPETFQAKWAFTNQFPVSSLAFSADGAVLGVAGWEFDPVNQARGATFWDLRTRMKLSALSIDASNAASVVFSKDGQWLALGCAGGITRLWNWKNQRPVAEFQRHSSTVRTLAFSNDSSLLASGGDDKVVLYNASGLGVCGVLEGHTAEIWCVAFSPDARTLASASDDGTIRLWNVATLQPILTFRGHIGSVASVAFSHDGTLLASCGADADVRLWAAPR